SLPPEPRGLRACVPADRRMRGQLGSLYQVTVARATPLPTDGMKQMGKETTAATSGTEDEIDLRELVGVLIDRKWWILATTALFFVLSVAYALLAPPVYRAQAMVQVESEMPSIPGLADLTS